MRFRAPEMADAPAVLAVLEARDRVDLGEVEHSLEDLLGEWRLSDFDLERGAQVVVTTDGRIVAYAAVRRPGAYAVVAPEHEGRGIGSRLLEWAEQRERELVRDVHRQWVAGANTSARRLLTGAGYHPARSYYRMVRSLDDAPARPAVPAGYALRSVDVLRDVAAMHAVDAASFAPAPDYEPESLAEFTEEHLKAHDFDAGLSGVASHEGRIVGFLLAGPRPEERVGYVHILAVAPEHQDRGVGTALLLGAFAAFAKAGLLEARLGVASYNERGLRVYERAGMTMRHRFDIYERPIGLASGAGQ
ncbi:MAG: GNAT family N-acetyltransferase [Solirubrobacterales bacterium]|nr:GNAT family N-acetyltransferase [Solirubrobacterales bacterium]